MPLWVLQYGLGWFLWQGVTAGSQQYFRAVHQNLLKNFFLSVFVIQCLYSGLLLSEDSLWHLSRGNFVLFRSFFQFVGTIQILILFPHLLEVSHSLTLSANIWAYIVIHHLGCTCRESDGLHDIAQFWPEASSSYSLCIAIQPAFTHFQVLPGLFFSSLLMRILCRTTVCSIWGKRMYIL